MNKKILLPAILLTGFLFSGAQEKLLTKGMKVSKSIKFKKAIYKLDAWDSLNKPVILIEGDNITIDFNNCTIKGSNSRKNPDEFFGVAVLIRNSNHVTIKNLKAKGYKVALMAKGVADLTIQNCDFSYNYRQHLNSGQDKEDISDWMSYHHNENDEWLRYGAAMYLRKCTNAVIRDCKVTGGQNALMMTECNFAMIYNNDLSFNSGIGIGLYRCSNNKILHNKIDFNVRGYSHGIYNRGQDSAGILMYEQSNNNLIYKNSVTHGGDGFFLWAGQTTMDTGEGGCNDNQIMENDFSYAPTNGVEVTFSRNQITHNRIYECDNAIWGGYSFNSAFTSNRILNNNVGIAIEHGQHNQIQGNIFANNKQAISLWSRPTQPSDWGYAKYRDTRSVDYRIAINNFTENGTVYDLKRTDSLEIFGNIYNENKKIYLKDSTVTNLDTTLQDIYDSTSVDYSLKNGMDPFKGNGKLAGRKNILITEWGPYDFRSPIIWNVNPVDTTDVMQFDLKGPKGKWRIRSYKGVDSFSVKSGDVPATITAKKMKGDKTDIKIEMEFVGDEITTAFGETIPKNKPYIFSFRKFFQPIDWTVNWFVLDTSINNPIKTNNLFPPNVRVRPIKTEKTDKLDYAWWGGIKVDKEQFPQFITVAEGTAGIENGEYELGVTWDDAVRVYVDDKMVIDEWNPSKYTFDESPNRKIKIKLGGMHRFRVEHLELGGFATLSVKLRKL
jgi:parallel beta-helix repeat protein